MRIPMPKPQSEPSEEDKIAQKFNRVGNAAVNANNSMAIDDIAYVFGAIRDSSEKDALLASAKTLIDAINASYVATINGIEDIEVLRHIATHFQSDSLPNVPKEELEDDCDDDVTDFDKVDCSKNYFLESSKLTHHEARLYVLYAMSRDGLPIVEFDREQVFSGLKDIVTAVTTFYPDEANEDVRSGFYSPYVTFINKID